MTIVRELITLLGFETDSDSFKEAEDDLDTLAKIAGGVTLSVTALGGSMIALAKMTADYGDDVKHVADMLGITSEAVQELRYAAKLANLDNSELTIGLRKLLQNAGEAQTGNKELAKSFAELGISQADLAKGEPLDVLFERVADRISKVDDPSKRAALAVKLLGRAGQELVPFMANGATSVRAMREEAQRLGLVMSEEAVANADAFNDAWDSTHEVVMGVARSIGGDLLPNGIKLLGFASEFIQQHRVMVREEIGSVFVMFSTGAKMAWTAVEHFIFPLVKLIGHFGGLRTVTIAASAAMAYFALTALGNLITSSLAATTAVGGLMGVLRVLSLAPALVAIKWILLAAAVALVFDEIYVTMNGGKSLINDFWVEFTKPFQPDDSWIVRAMKSVVQLAREGTEELRLLAALLSEMSGGEGVGKRWERFKKDWSEGNDVGIQAVKWLTGTNATGVFGKDSPLRSEEERRGMSLPRNASETMSLDNQLQSRTDADRGREHFPRVAAAMDAGIWNPARQQAEIEQAKNSMLGRGLSRLMSIGRVDVHVDARGQTDPEAIGMSTGTATRAAVVGVVQEAYSSVEGSEIE